MYLTQNLNQNLKKHSVYFFRQNWLFFWLYFFLFVRFLWILSKNLFLRRLLYLKKIQCNKSTMYNTCHNLFYCYFFLSYLFICLNHKFSLLLYFIFIFQGQAIFIFRKIAKGTTVYTIKVIIITDTSESKDKTNLRQWLFVGGDVSALTHATPELC